jgi:hypothetical protein
MTARFAAGIPTYYWHRQIMLQEQRIRTLAGGHTVAPRSGALAASPLIHRNPFGQLPPHRYRMA